MRILLKIFKYFLISCLAIIVLAVTLSYIFRDKIIALTFEEINKHLATKIEIDRNVDLSVFEKFPEISIKVKDVKVYESYPESEEKLANLKTLYFTFDAFDFIKGKYVLKNIYAENGDINIKINKSGLGNYFIFKSDTSSTKSNLSFDIRKIVLENVSVSYVNEPIHQSHSIHAYKVASSLKINDKSIYFGINGDLLIHQIGIGNNDYFKEKVISIKSNQEFHQGENLFKILPSELVIEGSDFKLSGQYDGTNKKVELNLKAEKNTMSTLISLLPGNIGQKLNQYKSSGEIYFEANVNGGLSALEQPSVDINFGFTNASFYHPDIDKKIERATLTGNFTNGSAHHFRTSKLTLKDINALIDGEDVTGELIIENFEDPFINCKAKGRVDINSLVKIFPVTTIKSAEGMLDVDVSFAGRPSDFKTAEGKEKIKTEGSIQIHDLNLLLTTSPLAYDGINGSFVFNKNDLTVDDFTGKIGNSDFSLTGSYKNFVNKLLSGKEKLIIDATLKSDKIDLNEILSAFPKGDTSSTERKGKFPYLEDFRFKFNCEVNQLHFNKLDARKIHGTIDFNQPILAIKDVHFKTAGGQVELDALVNFHSEERIEVNTKTALTNIHIDSVLYICDNFSQNFLQDKNLKGQYTGDIQCYFIMNNKYEIKTPSIIASIDASIINGELNDFEPMKKLSKFIDEKELAHIKFSELKNKIIIENNEIIIPEMNIKSNISNIAIQGTHTFDQQLDYKLSIPLKNFRKNHPDKDEAFGAIEDDNKGTSTVFITIKGTASDYKIAYDTKRTKKKIVADFKKEKQELEQLFKKKKNEQIQKTPNPSEYEFFEF